VLQEVVRANPGMEYLILDQTDVADIERFAAELVSRHPDVNVLINNAGVQRPEDLTSGDVFDAELQVVTNLLGPIRLTAALIPHLMTRSSATIINVTSGLAFVPNATMPTYSATKAALHSYTQSLRHQLRHHDIDVIEIVPPQVRTALRTHDDPRAMPLEAYLAETMALLSPDSPEEVLVSRVRPLRFAERDGQFDDRYRAVNATSPLAHRDGRGTR
jgi:uncharacterized oxidoreductase